MIAIFDYFDIDPGTTVIEHCIGEIQNNEYVEKSSYLRQDILPVYGEGNDSFAIVRLNVNCSYKLFKVLNKVDLIRKEYKCSKLYLVFNSDCQVKLHKNENNFVNILKLFLFCIVLRKNPLLLYSYKERQIALNLAPDWPDKVTGEGNVRSIFIYFKLLMKNISSLLVVNHVIFEIKP
jgi:hypothetical protein